jgi:hypothetical protein
MPGHAGALRACLTIVLKGATGFHALLESLIYQHKLWFCAALHSADGFPQRIPISRKPSCCIFVSGV